MCRARARRRQRSITSLPAGALPWRFIRWLYPGLRVKRWLVLFAVAVLLVGMGVAFSLSPGTVPALGSALARALRRPAGTTVPRGVLAALFLVLGMACGIVALRGAVLSIVDALAPFASENLGQALFWRRHRGRGLRVVAIGGGTGLPVLLRGLKRYSTNVTAVVTVGDDGGSSGQLRGELGILPPGDIRNCLLALAETEPLMEQVFQHRFQRGSLAGHAVGNVLLGGLTEVTGDFVQAVDVASRILAVRGRVLPSTTANLRLVAEMEDGSMVGGETAITAANRRIVRLRLDPEDAQALPAAVEAIRQADVVVMGPGSLYTSILPNLLLPEIAQAVQECGGLRIFVVNVMTQPGETSGYTAADHWAAVRAHAGPVADVVLVHVGSLDPERLVSYHEQGAQVVRADVERLSAMGVRVLARDVATSDGLIRHDPDRLAAAVLEEAVRTMGPPDARSVIDYYLLQGRIRHAARDRALDGASTHG